MLSGLVGCGLANDQAQDQNNTRNVGFNENNPVQIGNSKINERESFDQTDAYGYFKNNNNNNNNVQYRANENVDRDRGDRYNRDIFHDNTEDFNYHGQMNTTIGGIPTKSYDKPEDYHLAERMTDTVNRIKNVNQARVVINGDQVVVSVDSRTGNMRELEARIQQALHRYAKDKNVKVVTDRENFERLSNMNRQYGDGFDEFGATLREGFDTVNRAAERPFRNND